MIWPRWIIQNGSRLNSPPGIDLLPRLVRSVRRVIAVSEFTKRRLGEFAGVDPMKISVIPNGVDRRFRPCAATTIDDLRKRLKIPSERYVLSLGTVEPRKNLPVQLDAWSRCVERLPANTWLVIAGRVGQRHIFSNVNMERGSAVFISRDLCPTRICRRSIAGR